VTVVGVPDVPGTSLEIFSRIAARNITVDMIVQNAGERGKADITFTVPRDELPITLEAVGEAAQLLGAEAVTHADNVAKVSVVGLGMARQTGVAQKMFAALSEAGINIQMITTSEIKISVLVERDEAQRALRVVHQAFDLASAPPAAAVAARPLPKPAANVADVLARLQGIDMEELMIDDIVLDKSQARVTITGVPDAPGIAAAVFNDVAAAGIFVDMIVHSYGHDHVADLGFTVPKDKLQEAVAVAKKLAERLKCKGVTSSPDVAKLSVSGVGLRSHTGVAIRMFRSLSEAGINVGMINTSEVRVNVVVDGAHADQGLKCLQAAFADVLR
jgi:aspartate kinase